MTLKTNDAYDGLFDYYGQIYNVDPALGKTVFHVESNGNPNAPNGSSGEQGGMQIMPKLAQHYGIDARDMSQAIPAAMANLAEGLQASGGDPVGALRYYNGGPKALLNPQSTNGYVTKAQAIYPQIQVAQYAANGPPPGTGTDTPVQYADASSPNEQAFRSRWGLPGGAPAPTGPDESAFRARWGLTAPAAAASPPANGTKPAAASDAAMSAPDNRGDTAMTSAQLAASPALAARGPYAALEPSEPGFAHLLWSLGSPVGLGADVLGGARPVPIGAPNTEAFNMAGIGAGLGDLRFGNPLAFKAQPNAANPLASAPAIEPPAPSFTPAGRTFEVDAQGNVTQSGLPAVQPAPVAAGAPVNPLVSRAATPTVPLTAPAGRAVAPLTPAEQLIQGSIAARPTAPIPGAPLGAPAGAPPLGTPGYTPTTPGINPATASGLSPAEVAAYASMHDAPPPAPLFPPVSKAGAEALADQIIQYFHTGNQVQPGIALPPGYHPTLTGLTNDPGLATLHRGLESVSGTPAVIAQHNAQAINEAAARLQGQPGDANTMEAAVNKVTTPMREAAFANKTAMDPAKVQNAVDTANKQIAGPIGVDPGAAKVLGQVRDAMFESDGTTPRSNPEMMYGVHKLINKLLSPLAQSTDSDARAASSALMQIKPVVQSAIESGAGGFKAYMAKHADLMRSVDEQRLLESLNLTNATGDTRLASIDSAIKAIQRQQEMPGARKAKSVTDDKMDQLVALRNALRMEASRGTGKPINSTTFQNLATNSIVSRIGGSPLTGILGGHLLAPGLGEAVGYGASKAAESVFGRAEGLVRDALLERILNFSGKGEATLAAPQGMPRRGPLNSGPFSADAYRR